jgi:hypothetical protein
MCSDSEDNVNATVFYPTAGVMIRQLENHFSGVVSIFQLLTLD